MIHRLYEVLFRFWRPRRWRRLCCEFDLQGDESIVDVGGTISFWRSLHVRLPKVVVTNLDPAALRGGGQGEIAHVEADGCALPFRDREFDLAFSNSVIEHVGSWERQVDFAREMARVGRKVWVQTPAREFPIEPHFIGVAIHWLPERARPFAARWFSLRGWIDAKEAAVLSRPGVIRLLTLEEMRKLFPDCAIIIERFLGLPKSYVAIRKGS